MRLIDADKLKIVNLGIGDYNIWGVEDCDINNAPTVKAIPIEVVEQIREEIDKLPIYIAKFTDCAEIHICKDNVLEIIDKALKEVSNEQSDI